MTMPLFLLNFKLNTVSELYVSRIVAAIDNVLRILIKTLVYVTV